jgi:hypothetical protein
VEEVTEQSWIDFVAGDFVPLRASDFVVFTAGVRLRLFASTANGDFPYLIFLAAAHSSF